MSQGAELQLPTLPDFAITSPIYLRKINSRAHWEPEDCSSLEERAKAVARKLFGNEQGIYSLWYITNEAELYGVVAVLSAGRTPKNQNLDFICMTPTELEAAGITPQPVEEGDCLRVQDLHCNAQIDAAMAETLCLNLLKSARQARRCKKNPHTKPILEHQQKIGCRATETTRLHCDCEV